MNMVCSTCSGANDTYILQVFLPSHCYQMFKKGWNQGRGATGEAAAAPPLSFATTKKKKKMKKEEEEKEKKRKK